MSTQRDSTDVSRAATDFAALRARLTEARGREFWRGLEDVADTAQLEAFVRAELPHHAAVLDGLGRRQFLTLMGASLALAGLNACTRQPAEKIVPYVRKPEEIVPGKPLYFATAMPLAGFGMGVLVESHMGRPTKVEGNPRHPASLGATDAFAQASVLGLYDPDRSQVVRYVTEIRPWSTFVETMRPKLEALRERQGRGLRILTGRVTSPTLASQLRELLQEYPAARWHQYEPTASDHARAGAQLAFGEDVSTQYRLATADVILALDADFLACGPASVRMGREFARRRRPPHDGHGSMNRLYVVECTPSVTGAAADHRLPLRAGDVQRFAAAVLSAVRGLPAGSVDTGEQRRWVEAVAGDLLRHRGSGAVIVGDQQPAVVHAIGHALNEALGNVGRSVVYTEPVEAEPVHELQSLRDLVADMDAGAVEVLLILGGNPVYDAPVDLRFSDVLAKVPLRVHLGLYDDETAELCHWHIPESHYLESWSDVRAFDGTVTIVQPLIAPLYASKTAHEVLLALSNRPQRSGYDAVREYWKTRLRLDDAAFELFWRKALHEGVVPETAAAAKAVRVRDGQDFRVSATPAEGLEIVFRADATVFDGRFANLGWLQELPKPMTKLTWDNAALISPVLAERLGLANEDVIELRYQGRTVRAPVWISPGHAEGAVTVDVGYGRKRTGAVGTGAGFDAYALRTAEAPWFGGGLEVTSTGERHRLASTQLHHSMEGRDLVRAAALADYQAHPDIFHEGHHAPGPGDSMFPPWPYDGYKWGMTIDLSACIGCNACVVACQSENNIPVVGKDQVWRGREMHWLRIDRYYTGGLENPETYHQPVPCMHCENAPCEVVCPVNATVHSAEGLNEMVYNRCVGTKYCSNNCPYKVRRFNFYLYSNQTVDTLKMLQNPDVTVRSRGIMEKCTYCVQRINAARIQAKVADDRIRDGDVVTACQQACPTEAIVFGDLNDPTSRVAQQQTDHRRYGLLAELNTRPRTTYLAALRNPNPELTA
jgi:MoCo/4Fe-4S cofactor protein with predicted Tat translocation signal